MTDIDPSAVMAAHSLHCDNALCCEPTDPKHEYNNGHCEPYRLAEALAVSEAKVARVEALHAEHYCQACATGYGSCKTRTALADRPEQAS